MSPNKALIALDVGEKRIGVAIADGVVAIASPFVTIEADDTEISQVSRIVQQENVGTIVIGYPRNQSGEPTAQSEVVEKFRSRLEGAVNIAIVYQDESLTSVLAEERLKSYRKPYTKADIDALAAALILQDYVETKQK